MCILHLYRSFQRLWKRTMPFRGRLRWEWHSYSNLLVNCTMSCEIYLNRVRRRSFDYRTRPSWRSWAGWVVEWWGVEWWGVKSEEWRVEWWGVKSEGWSGEGWRVEWWGVKSEGWRVEWWGVSGGVVRGGRVRGGRVRGGRVRGGVVRGERWVVRGSPMKWGVYSQCMKL
jgi:hypothetical protein